MYWDLLKKKQKKNQNTTPLNCASYFAPRLSAPLPSLHFKGAVQHCTVAHLAVWECYSMVCVWGVGNLSWSVCREAKLLWCYAKTFWSHLWLFGHIDGLQANSKQPGRHADHYYVILNREEIQTISKQQVKHSTTQRNVYCVASVAFSHAKQPAQLS